MKATKREADKAFKDASALCLDKSPEEWEAIAQKDWCKLIERYQVKVLGVELHVDRRHDSNVFTKEEAVFYSKLWLIGHLSDSIFGMAAIMLRNEGLKPNAPSYLDHLEEVADGYSAEYEDHHDEWLKDLKLFMDKYPVLHSKDKPKFNELVSKLYTRFIGNGIIEILPHYGRATIAATYS